LNEAGSFVEAGGADWNSEFDITTVTEAVTDDWTRATASTARQMKRLQRQQQRKKNKKRQIVSKGKDSKGLFQFLWKRRSSRSSMGSQPQHAPEKGGDAWMCGVCGQAFSTLDAADKHESRHIQQVVDSLGWAVGRNSLRNNDDNNSFMNTPSNAHDVFVGKQFPSFGGESESTNSIFQQQERAQQKQQPQQQSTMLVGAKASAPMTVTMRRRTFHNQNRLESFQEDLEEDRDHDQFDFLPEDDKFPDFVEEEKVPEDGDTSQVRARLVDVSRNPPIQTICPNCFRRLLWSAHPNLGSTSSEPDSDHYAPICFR
jgi:hypothetical protein